ncbi:hypothetical protein ACLN6O_05760 [Acinetobacter sp. PVC-6A]|uniref:hypothetical protein n=1 Tax=Acinetobacter TaxID=469 RepID=UPI003AF8428B
MNKVLIESISLEKLKELMSENDPQDLDIFEDVNRLSFVLNNISVDSNLYESLVYVCKIDIISFSNLKIAYYKTVLNMDYEVIDDFFVTLIE